MGTMGKFERHCFIGWAIQLQRCSCWNKLRWFFSADMSHLKRRNNKVFIKDWRPRNIIFFFPVIITVLFPSAKWILGTCSKVKMDFSGSLVTTECSKHFSVLFLCRTLNLAKTQQLEFQKCRIKIDHHCILNFASRE